MAVTSLHCIDTSVNPLIGIQDWQSYKSSEIVGPDIAAVSVLPYTGEIATSAIRKVKMNRITQNTTARPRLEVLGFALVELS